MTDCDPREIAAYEVVRQRTLRLVQQHPWIRDISVALAGRECLACLAQRCVENPPGEFRCLACEAQWTQADIARKHRPRSKGVPA